MLCICFRPSHLLRHPLCIFILGIALVLLAHTQPVATDTLAWGLRRGRGGRWCCCCRHSWCRRDMNASSGWFLFIITAPEAARCLAAAAAGSGSRGASGHGRCAHGGHRLILTAEPTRCLTSGCSGRRGCGSGGYGNLRGRRLVQATPPARRLTRRRAGSGASCCRRCRGCGLCAVTFVHFPLAAISALWRHFALRNVIVLEEHVGDDGANLVSADAYPPALVGYDIVHAFVSSMTSSFQSVACK